MACSRHCFFSHLPPSPPQRLPFPPHLLDLRFSPTWPSPDRNHRKCAVCRQPTSISSPIGCGSIARAATGRERTASALPMHEVEFTWKGGGFEVLLTGDFLGWETKLALEKGTDGAFHTKQKLSPGNYRYKYIVDGKLLHSPDCPACPDGTGGLANEIIVTGKTSESKPLLKKTGSNDTMKGPDHSKIAKEKEAGLDEPKDSPSGLNSPTNSAESTERAKEDQNVGSTAKHSENMPIDMIKDSVNEKSKDPSNSVKSEATVKEQHKTMSTPKVAESGPTNTARDSADAKANENESKSAAKVSENMPIDTIKDSGSERLKDSGIERPKETSNSVSSEAGATEQQKTTSPAKVAETKPIDTARDSADAKAIEHKSKSAVNVSESMPIDSVKDSGSERLKDPSNSVSSEARAKEQQKTTSPPKVAESKPIDTARDSADAKANETKSKSAVKVSENMPIDSVKDSGSEVAENKPIDKEQNTSSKIKSEVKPKNNEKTTPTASRKSAGKPEKKIKAKPLADLILEDVIPVLKDKLEKEEAVSNVELLFDDNKLEGSFTKRGIIYSFWAYFPDGKLEGSRGFSLTSHGAPPSTIEPFLIDEKKISGELVVFWITKRLFAQNLLSLN